MDWLVVVAGAVSGGFINGLAGFGTALFALGWWLQVMPPVQAVAITLAASVATGLQGVVLVRNDIEWRRLSLFLLPAMAGIPIGLQILHRIDASLLKIVIAGFLLLYGGFFMFRRNLPAITRPTPAVDIGIGFFGGILGAIAGLSGALPTMWISMRNWTKMKSRSILQPYNVAVLGVSAVLLAFTGAYDWETLLLLAVVLPVAMVAAQIGLRTFKLLSDGHFRRLLIVLMFVSGMVILIRELL